MQSFLIQLSKPNDKYQKSKKSNNIRDHIDFHKMKPLPYRDVNINVCCLFYLMIYYIIKASNLHVSSRYTYRVDAPKCGHLETEPKGGGLESRVEVLVVEHILNVTHNVFALIDFIDNLFRRNIDLYCLFWLSNRDVLLRLIRFELH